MVDHASCSIGPARAHPAHRTPGLPSRLAGSTRPLLAASHIHCTLRPAVEAVGLDVGLDPAGDLVADAPALGHGGGGGRARRCRSAGWSRDWIGRAPGPRSGELGQGRRVDPGAVDHDDRGQLGDPLGLAPVGEIGQAVGADQEEQVVLGPVARGPPPGSRRCSGGRAVGPRSPRPRRPGGPRWRSGPSPGGRPPAVRSPGLCGGAPATTNQTRSRPQRLAARLGQDQVPQVDRVERPAEQPQSHRVGPSRGSGRAPPDFRVDRRAEIG